MSKESTNQQYESMGYPDLLYLLQSGSNSESAAATKELLARTANDNECYQYLDVFCMMLTHKNAFIRGRGIQLVCAQAKWDADNWFSVHLHEILPLLQDEKPTVARQTIKAMYAIIEYQPKYSDAILQELALMDGEKYAEDARKLVIEDAEKLRAVLMGEAEAPWQKKKGKKDNSKPNPIGGLIALCLIWAVTCIYSVVLEYPLFRYYTADERDKSSSTYTYSAAWNESIGESENITTIHWRNNGDEEWHSARVKTRDYMLFWIPIGLCVLVSLPILESIIKDFIRMIKGKKLKDRPANDM